MIVTPLVPKVSDGEVAASEVCIEILFFISNKRLFFLFKETIHEKARKLLEEIKESMNKDEHKFGMSELNSLRTIADELEHDTCKHIMRYIFQEGSEIERYPQAYRERFDIAFSQAVIILQIYLFI